MDHFLTYLQPSEGQHLRWRREEAVHRGPSCYPEVSFNHEADYR